MRRGAVAVVLVLAATAYLALALARPLARPTVSARPPGAGFAPGPVSLAWPKVGEAAVGVQGVGVIGAHGADGPVPIASIAKVMTALVVLGDHPLRGSAGGPRIEVTPREVAVYRADVVSGQSVVAVRAGEQLTEREALEALLLPSGNNIATLLAVWDAGSEPAFVAKMNSRARALGLRRTHYTGASGVQANTVSTASEQVRLAMRAMQVPVFAQTVAMTHTTLPVAGRQANKDTLLGKDGIVGIKPGTTLEAGECFLFAAREDLAGRPVTILGAVLHQTANRPKLGSLAAASHASLALLDSTRRVLAARLVVRHGTALGSIQAPWATTVRLLAGRSAVILGWPGLPVHNALTLRQIDDPISAGQQLGTDIVTAGAQRYTIPLVAARGLPAASPGWRLTHP